ncbi:MAG TPA: hypothetical protein VII69_03250 [Candidatus Eremiobacteraceae bacterium]
MRVRRPLHPSPLTIVLSSAIISLVLSAAVVAAPTTSQSLRVLPPNGSSQAFAVSMHFDVPAGAHNHGPGSGHGPQDESGNMVVKRTDLADAAITLTGVADSSSASHSVSGQTVDAGSPPDPYIVAFDNAASIAAGESASVKAGDSWQTSIQTVDASGTVNSINVKTVVSTASGDSIQLHATGNGTETFSTPRGDRTADVTVDITESLVGNRLIEFDQKFSRTMQGHMGSFKTTATTTLKSS